MDELWQKLVEQLVLNAIPLLVPLVIAWVVRLLTQVWSEFKANRPEVAYYVESAAEFAVTAAEQVGLSGKLSEFADSKLDYAMEMAQRWLAENNVKYIDIDLLRAAIEAEVLKQFPKKSE